MVHAGSDAVRSAESRWSKHCQQPIERAKVGQGEAWMLSDDECMIGKNTLPEQAQAVLDKIGIRISVRTLIEQAYAIEGEPSAPDT